MNISERAENYGIEKLIPLEKISLITSIDIEKFKNYKTIKELLNNIDEIKATKLQKNKLRALLEIIKYTSKEEIGKVKISNPWDVYKFYSNEMRLLEKEVFKVILLNTKNEIIVDIDVSVGTINSSLVHPREVFKEAVKRNANSMIVMHNHPSGSIEPSKEDKNITKRLIECGNLMGIEILDHIIIGDGLYFSFKEDMLM